MAATVLTKNAKEKSTFVISVALLDEGGDPVTPNTMTWTLTDSVGTAINSRTDIDYETDNGTGSGGSLGATNYIVLNGDDLAIQGVGTQELRILTAEGTYDSSNGTDLPFRERCIFYVENLVAVS